MSTAAFEKIYRKDIVSKFFEYIDTIASNNNIAMFKKYHTQNVLNDFMGLWPPPSMYELWDRWINLPDDEKTLYTPKKNKYGSQ